MAVYERYAYGDGLLEMHVYKSYHSRKRVFGQAGLSPTVRSAEPPFSVYASEVEGNFDGTVVKGGLNQRAWVSQE
jgi:hypothetical protein